MKINYTTCTKIIIFTLLIIISSSKLVNSEIIKKIEVSGNERLAKETIILFTELKVNDDIYSEDLNNAFKRLFETNYFKDVKIRFNKGYLEIDVVENPLIQLVIINGIKNKRILDELNKITKKIEKYHYL